MASKSTHIADFQQAVENGTIPGAVSTDKKKFVFNKLQYAGKNKNTYSWQIFIEIMDEDGVAHKIHKRYYDCTEIKNYCAKISVFSDQGGKTRKFDPTIVTKGKNLGKANQTNVFTQALKDSLGIYNKKKQTIIQKEESADFPLPMLVQNINSSKSSILTDNLFTDGLVVQKKLDGLRIITMYKNDNTIMYSRTSREYLSQSHIKESINNIYNSTVINIDNIPIPEEYKQYYTIKQCNLDGEIYEHGKPLNWISGQTRKETYDSTSLSLYCFDLFFPNAIKAGHNLEYRYRNMILKQLLLNDDTSVAAEVDLVTELTNNKYKHVKVLNTYNVNTVEEVNTYLQTFLDQKFEGVIIRKLNKGYQYSENNYHSPNIIKLKPDYDSEFKVIDFTAGTKGKSLDAIIWICETEDGKKTFNVVPKIISDNDRKELYTLMKKVEENGKTFFENKIKGLPLTVEYKGLSPDNVPTLAKALLFRTYESGEENDPIKRIFASQMKK